MVFRLARQRALANPADALGQGRPLLRARALPEQREAGRGEEGRPHEAVAGPDVELAEQQEQPEEHEPDRDDAEGLHGPARERPPFRGPVVLGDQEPAEGVGDDAEAADERERGECQADEDRIDAEIVADAGGHPGDHTVVGASIDLPVAVLHGVPRLPEVSHAPVSRRYPG